MTAASDIRMALLANGYTPLACDRETKRPVITGWPEIVVRFGSKTDMTL